MEDDILLSPAELERVTGGYVQPAAQLAELLRQGFFRARRSRVNGRVILERAHYDAVCAVRGGQEPQEAARPRVRPPTPLRAV